MGFCFFFFYLLQLPVDVKDASSAPARALQALYIAQVLPLHIPLRECKFIKKYAITVHDSRKSQAVKFIIKSIYLT